ncbi:hypothetical protein V6N13_114579 [Hibiscus sabdariffa]|uniref:Uncharacterized protein n=1 Tax=Hibiscus sabdariffa TaxID=183260 RepID=A0ABR2U2J0_9ROSI
MIPLKTRKIPKRKNPKPLKNSLEKLWNLVICVMYIKIVEWVKMEMVCNCSTCLGISGYGVNHDLQALYKVENALADNIDGLSGLEQGFGGPPHAALQEILHLPIVA